MSSPNRILRNKSHLANLGVSMKDVKVIKDVITIAKELRENFDYTPKASVTTTDILFINADNEQAMALYAKHSEKMHAEPIFVYNGKSEGDVTAPDLLKYPNAKTLSTPIRLVELKSLLLEIISTPMLKPENRSALSNKADCFKMLVVDDSFPVRKYMEEKLPLLMAEIDIELDFDIQYASSGREAVDKVKAARGAYDMVFLDVMMDDIDGYKICKWIKKVKRSINVVMLTSKSSTIDRVKANFSGCDDFLSKPPRDASLKKVLLKFMKIEQAA